MRRSTLQHRSRFGAKPAFGTVILVMWCALKWFVFASSDCFFVSNVGFWKKTLLCDLKVNKSISSSFTKSVVLVLPRMLYGNLRLKLRAITADILRSDGIQFTSESFESKRLVLLINSKTFIPQIFLDSCGFEKWLLGLHWVFVKIHQRDQQFCLVCVLLRSEMLLASQAILLLVYPGFQSCVGTVKRKDQ